MIKFKTLFGKGRSSSSSSSASKNKNATDRIKINHFESGPVSENPNDNEFDKQAVTCNDELEKMSNTNYSEEESIRKRLESVLEENNKMESALQELIVKHGELETLQKEIETLKVIAPLTCIIFLSIHVSII